MQLCRKGLEGYKEAGDKVRSQSESIRRAVWDTGDPGDTALTGDAKKRRGSKVEKSVGQNVSRDSDAVFC